MFVTNRLYRGSNSVGLHTAEQLIATIQARATLPRRVLADVGVPKARIHQILANPWHVLIRDLLLMTKRKTNIIPPAWATITVPQLVSCLCLLVTRTRWYSDRVCCSYVTFVLLTSHWFSLSFFFAVVNVFLCAIVLWVSWSLVTLPRSWRRCMLHGFSLVRWKVDSVCSLRCR